MSAYDLIPLSRHDYQMLFEDSPVSQEKWANFFRLGLILVQIWV